MNKSNTGREGANEKLRCVGKKPKARKKPRASRKAQTTPFRNCASRLPFKADTFAAIHSIARYLGMDVENQRIDERGRYCVMLSVHKKYLEFQINVAVVGELTTQQQAILLINTIIDACVGHRDLGRPVKVVSHE